MSNIFRGLVNSQRLLYGLTQNLRSLTAVIDAGKSENVRTVAITYTQPHSILRKAQC